MKARRIALSLTAFLLLRCGPEQPAPTPRLVLIGVDGGSWNLIDPMLAAGRLPNLETLRGRGVTAELSSLLPLNSPTVWTSIATGRNPQVHGVSFFYDNRDSVQVPTVWERLAAAGLRVGLYDYLVTWPPRNLPGGFVVPGWLRRDRAVTPSDLFERIGLPAYAYSLEGVAGPDAILTAVERETTDKARYWNRMSEELDIDAGAVVFYSVDAVSHRFWHAAFPQEFETPLSSIATDSRFRSVIHDTLEAVDRAIGQIVAALRPEDNVVIVSDHGFQARRQGVDRVWGFHAPWLLARGGIEPKREAVTVITDWRHLILKLEPGPAAERESMTRRLEDLLTSVRSAAGAPVFYTTTVYPQRAAEAFRGRPAQHVEFAQRLIQRFEPAHAFIFALPIPGRLDPPASDAVVEVAGERFPLTRLATGHEFAGDHHPTGIFLAAGSAIRHRAERARLSVVDVAPLLTYLAGQPIPDDLEGRLLKALLEPGYLRRFPARSVAASDAPRLTEGGEPNDEAEEEDSELRRRLEALGYV